MQRLFKIIKVNKNRKFSYLWKRKNSFFKKIYKKNYNNSNNNKN